jgi:hypothetical protein
MDAKSTSGEGIMLCNDPLKGGSIKALMIFTHGLSNFRSSKSVYSEGMRQAILGILFQMDRTSGIVV